MAYVVTQSCCSDASCVVACPVNCIHPAPGEPGFAESPMVYVDPQACVGCGACATACPVGAIGPSDWLTDHQLPFKTLNAEYYQAFPHEDRTPLALVPAQRRLRHAGPYRVAVIGAGPAGFYTADELLKHPEIVAVDVYDRLLTPYGLVRHGVAPDHPTTKQVTNLFADIASNPRFRYFLGVEIGRDLTLAQLRAHYDGVVYAVGASTDRALGLPGEHLRGSLAATALVGWYNGHPDQRDLDVPLDHERAVVVGNGNVALDVARILTGDPDALSLTDLAAGPLAALRDSAVREVLVLGRRGPAEAAFTVPELIGLSQLTEVDVVLAQGSEVAGVSGTAGRILADLAQRRTRIGKRRIVLRFTTSPVEILGTDRVTGVRVVRNDLVTGDDGRVRAVATDEFEDISAGLVIRSIGFKGMPVADLPFDETTGTVPNDRGRVEPGVYVAGWIKRGPTGFIGTNKSCAEETVAAFLDDLDLCLTAAGSADPIDELVSERCPQVIDGSGWERIDAAEREHGEAVGRPRLKVVDPGEQARLAQRQKVGVSLW